MSQVLQPSKHARCRHLWAPGPPGPDGTPVRRAARAPALAARTRRRLAGRPAETSGSRRVFGSLADFFHALQNGLEALYVVNQQYHKSITRLYKIHRAPAAGMVPSTLAVPGHQAVLQAAQTHERAYGTTAEGS